MKLNNLRRWAVTLLLVIGTTGVGVIAPATSASAANGCSSQPHRVHTSDTSPYRGWACWVDNGDKIKVCDTAPNDGVHVHADLWFDAGGFWYKFIAEDDGADAGCDLETGGDLKGYNRLKLRVCAQRADQTNFACNQTIWYESE